MAYSRHEVWRDLRPDVQLMALQQSLLPAPGESRQVSPPRDGESLKSGASSESSNTIQVASNSASNAPCHREGGGEERGGRGEKGWEDTASRPASSTFTDMGSAKAAVDGQVQRLKVAQSYSPPCMRGQQLICLEA